MKNKKLMNNNPLISIIVPTRNSQLFLGNCLRSIKKQTYSKIKYEVLILDGGSTDKTLEIVRMYKKIIPIRIVGNEKVDAESGKYKGIKESKGEFIILLDSDNEIVDKKWLATGINIMGKHKEVWGLESPWLVNEKDPLINQYFTLLRIADPLARLLNPWRKPLKDYGVYEMYRLKKNDVIVTGANGFFWRKSAILPYLNKLEKFEEVNFVSKITEDGITYFAKLKELGIYHYYCNSFYKYLSKRIKIANKFNKRRELKQKTWVDNVPKMRLYFSILYNFSIIGPLTEAVICIIRSRNIAWIYHPAISFVTVTIYTYTIIKRVVFIR